MTDSVEFTPGGYCLAERIANNRQDHITIVNEAEVQLLPEVMALLEQHNFKCVQVVNSIADSLRQFVEQESALTLSGGQLRQIDWSDFSVGDTAEGCFNAVKSLVAAYPKTIALIVDAHMTECFFLDLFRKSRLDARIVVLGGAEAYLCL